MISGYQAMYPRWLGRLVFYWVFPPVVWFFQARMPVVLKRNIERATRAAAAQVTVRRTF
ncbi:MAG TPA: hypothetical protein VGN28_05200 [Blastococcus sp.]|nr:hypothetical protein [Blastococcus sp.]